MANRRDPLKPADLALLIGLPIGFLIVFWLGIQSFLPDPPPPSGVRLLRQGSVETGMSIVQVEKKLPPPDSVIEKEDGGLIYLYRRTVFDNDLASEDAFVEFSADGIVTGIRFDRVGLPPPRE